MIDPSVEVGMDTDLMPRAQRGDEAPERRSDGPAITLPAAGLRYYADPYSFRSHAVDARVWSGLHFRTSDQVSITIGTHQDNYALDHYFAPTD